MEVINAGLNARRPNGLGALRTAGNKWTDGKAKQSNSGKFFFSSAALQNKPFLFLFLHPRNGKFDMHSPAPSLQMLQS